MFADPNQSCFFHHRCNGGILAVAVLDQDGSLGPLGCAGDELPVNVQAVFATVEEFATEIGMVPIAIHKEKAGYVLNTLLVPLLNAGMGLAAGGYASVEDIDKTWRIATGAPLGPLQILDVIGLTTPYNILTHSSTGDEKLATWLKETYIDQGKLGVATGEGFYKYA